MDSFVSQLHQGLDVDDVELRLDQGGAIEEKLHPRFQTEVRSAFAIGQKRPAHICQGHNLAESMCSKWIPEHEACGEAAFTKRQLSQTEALQKDRRAEVLRGKLALENETLLKGLQTTGARCAMIEEAIGGSPQMSLTGLYELFDARRS